MYPSFMGLERWDCYPDGLGSCGSVKGGVFLQLAGCVSRWKYGAGSPTWIILAGGLVSDRLSLWIYTLWSYPNFWSGVKKKKKKHGRLLLGCSCIMRIAQIKRGTWLSLVTRGLYTYLSPWGMVHLPDPRDVWFLKTEDLPLLGYTQIAVSGD